MDVLKKLFITLILISSPDIFAANVVQEYIELQQQEVFLYPKEVFTSYVLSEKKGKVEFKVENSKLIIKAISGRVVIQSLLKDGSIVNLSVNIIRRPRTPTTLLSNKDKEYRGYYFRWRNSYVDSWNNGKSTSPTHFGSQLSMGTKVGPNNFFSMDLNYRENLDLLYFLKWRHKKVYIAHGDNSPPRIPTLPKTIQIPRVRQYTVGYEDNFFFDLWTAKFSPTGRGLSNGIIGEPTSSQVQGYNNQQNDWFSGGQLGYKKDNFGIYSMIWKNPRNQNSMIYLGANTSILKDQIKISGAINPDTAFPQFYSNIDFVRKNENNDTSWHLKKSNLYYEIAPKGQQQLLFDSLLPREELVFNSSFYSTNRNFDKGSIFLDLNYNYLLNGSLVSHTPSTLFGWGNSHFEVFTGYSVTNTEISYLGQKINQTRLNPGIEFFLRPKSNKTNYSIVVGQTFNEQKDNLNNNFKMQESNWAIKAKNNNWNAELAFGRVYNETGAFQRAAYRVKPSIGYNSPKFKVGAYVNLLFNEEDYAQYNSERAGLNIGWSPNINHLIELRGSQIKDSANRESQRLYLGYTMKFGDQNKSIIQSLDSKKLTINFFEDLNFNKVKDDNEKGFSGIKVKAETLTDKKEEVSNENGQVRISGLSENSYSLSIDPTSLPEGYLIMESPYSLDFKVADSLEYNLAVLKVKKKNITLKAETSEEEFFNATVQCQNKKESTYIFNINQSQEIIYPEKDKCKLIINLMQSDYTVTKNNVDLIDDFNGDIYLKKQDHILGQVFWDKNNNKTYDFGEELVGVKIFFSSEKTAVSDSNGTWILKKISKINNLVYKKSEKSGFACESKFEKNIKNNPKKEVFLIICKKY